MNSGRYLTPYQVERYPHFSALLRDVIGNKLSSTTATKSKEHERRSLLTNYVRARNDYETIKLVYDLVWDIITEKSSEEKVCTTNGTDQYPCVSHLLLCFSVCQAVGSIISFFGNDTLNENTNKSE